MGIATSSTEEGLDFACNLLIGAIQAASADPSFYSRAILSSLAQYLRFRYVGELGLAFEELAALGSDLKVHLKRPAQYMDQMSWVKESLAIVSPNKSLERTREG